MGILKRTMDALGVALKPESSDPIPLKPGKKLTTDDMVRVRFRELWEEAPQDTSLSGTYVYYWPWKKPRPVLGWRVVVQGYDGQASAVIVAMGATRDEMCGVKPVLKIATEEDIRQATARYRKSAQGWLDMMRKAAGLKSTSRRTVVPNGFPDIPPERISGTIVPPPDADHYGSVWWKAYKLARDEEERKTFYSLAKRWYNVRDNQ